MQQIIFLKVHVEIVTDFKAQLMLEKNCPGQRVYSPSRATLGESTFRAFPYKTWRAIHMRKKLARLDGSSTLPYHPYQPFSMHRACASTVASSWLAQRGQLFLM